MTAINNSNSKLQQQLQKPNSKSDHATFSKNKKTYATIENSNKYNRKK